MSIHNLYHFDAGLKWDHVFGKNMVPGLSTRDILNSRPAVASLMNGDTCRSDEIGFVVTLELRF